MKKDWDVCLGRDVHLHSTAQWSALLAGLGWTQTHNYRHLAVRVLHTPGDQHTRSKSHCKGKKKTAVTNIKTHTLPSTHIRSSMWVHTRKYHWSKAVHISFLWTVKLFTLMLMKCLWIDWEWVKELCWLVMTWGDGLDKLSFLFMPLLNICCIVS